MLAMVLGGLRPAEVRSLRLADVDMGMRRVRVVGKGGQERVVPIDEVFFAELRRLSARGTPGCVLVRRSASWCCVARPPGSR